jgi:hypothetical protein
MILISRSLPAPLFRNTAKGGSKIAMMIRRILFIIDHSRKVLTLKLEL